MRNDNVTNVLLDIALSLSPTVRNKIGTCWNCGRKFSKSVWDVSELDTPVRCENKVCNVLNDDYKLEVL